MGLTVPGGNQVVEDEVGVVLADPAGLVLAAAVLQVEHRVAFLQLGVVVKDAPIITFPTAYLLDIRWFATINLPQNIPQFRHDYRFLARSHV